MRNEPDFLEYLSYHNKCTEELYNKSCVLSYSDIDLGTSKLALKVRRMVGEVRREIHLLRGFVRLKCPNRWVSYGTLEPTHATGAIISSYLARRFPYTIIILGNKNESWVSIFAENRVCTLTCGSLSSTVEDVITAIGETTSLENFEKVWKEYYASQCRKERSSTRRFFKSMPKKHIRAAKLDMEKSGSLTTLDDFIRRP